MRVLLLDNYDSYTWILASQLGRILGEMPDVIENDRISIEQIRARGYDAMVISPGPGRPERREDFGVCSDVFDAFPNTPILGVCLGHQGLGLWAGGKVVQASPVHGYTSDIFHEGDALFQGIPIPFRATRYHSLILDRCTLPDNLRVTGWAVGGQVMAIQHRERPFYGVQFHPESIATPFGLKILANFLGLVHPDPQVRPRWKPPRLDAATFVRPPWPEKFPWVEPEDVFLEHFAALPAAFWLDSGGQDRWSVMGTGVVIEAPLDALPLSSAKLPPGGFFYGPGLYGVLGYEALTGKKGALLPSSLWLDVLEVLVFDHQDGCVYAPQTWKDRLESCPVAPKGSADARLLLERDCSSYLTEIATIFEALENGESYEVCLTLGARVELGGKDALDYFRWLRQRSPARYGAFFRFPQGAVVSVSPELLVQVGSMGRVSTEPIKGTQARGQTEAEDEALFEQLLNSPKDIAELRMITDLLRNDLARVCRVGTVTVAEERVIRGHAQVWHASSLIMGWLREEVGQKELVEAVFPGGSITGAPKKRTMEILAGLEKRARGVYTGSVGYLGKNGASCLSVAIRTAEFDAEGRGYTGAGGAIVMDSDPNREFEEVLLKLGVMGALV